MRFADEITISIKAGNGGNGCVSFRREKYVPDGGPDGGNGGKGGSIIFEGTSNMQTLADYRYSRHFRAENGKSGSGKNKNGHSGKDLVLRVPLGTEIVDNFTQEVIVDITADGQKEIIIKGGSGGSGNSCFKSSTNQAPKQATAGEVGGEMDVTLKLKLMCDIGLIGMPNAGKSSFLRAFTNATPKVADYPFTTLTPNLGVVDFGYSGFVIADIPGIIEGASSGAGLGRKFIKHIQRCAAVLHIIDASEDVVKNYKIIKKELQKYDKELALKPEIVLLNKIDLLKDGELEAKIKKLQKAFTGPIFSTSIISLKPSLGKLESNQGQNSQINHPLIIHLHQTVLQSRPDRKTKSDIWSGTAVTRSGGT